jgi:acyl transferase domain-containing protein/NAD(P)-dependent dehydrogenase (short-subunit alcohol dehydrogenase family)
MDVAQSQAAPVAIIGMGCMFPKAADLADYWSNIQNRVDAIGDIPPSHWRPEDYYDADSKTPDMTYASRGGFLSPVDFPPLDFGISPNTLEATDTTQLLGLMVARQALEDAGYGAQRSFDRSRVSVILGVTGTLELVIPLGARLGHPQWRRAMLDAGVPEEQVQKAIEKISDSYVGWQEDSFPGLLGNVVAGRIANRLDLGGTNCVVDAACASSLSAVHLAMLELTAGRCDMVLTGGMDTFNDIFMYMCFSKTPALSPTGDARPFDAQGDGTILGEGLGCLVLKRLADAERDADRIYAVIRSIGTSSDGKGQAIYAPSPKGQVQALRKAHEIAGVMPETIELIEGHGTGTRAGDLAEVKALTDVFATSNGQGSWCALGSVKSQIGHTKAAAGAAGLIKAAMALHDKILPPTAKVTQPIEQLADGRSAFYLNTKKRPWISKGAEPRRAGVSAFGFGGSNFHCVLEEYKPSKSRTSWDGNTVLLALSASSRDKLAKDLSQQTWPVTWKEFRLLAKRSVANFSCRDEFRLIAVIEKDLWDAAGFGPHLLSLLNRYANKTHWHTPDRVYFGSGDAPGKLAVLFPGQGSQYVGMLRDLTCAFPQMHEALANANKRFVSAKLDYCSRSLVDCIYPQSAFAIKEINQNESLLRYTAIAQPALGALSRGCLAVLSFFGIHPEAVAGHSYGELSALFAAKCIDESTLDDLSVLRGMIMAKRTGVSGGMLAVASSETNVLAFLQSYQLDLVIANKNSPNQVVLSGLETEIRRASSLLRGEGIQSKALAVSGAFHSPLVGSAPVEFSKVLDDIDFAAPAMPVYANTTGEKYGNDPAAIRSLLSNQLANPVEFTRMIENMHRDGVRTFVELGPSNKLSGLVDAILKGRDHSCCALDSSSGNRSGMADLGRCLSQLAALGHQVDLANWDERQLLEQNARSKKPSHAVSICGANYVKPKQASSKSSEGNKSKGTSGGMPLSSPQRKVSTKGSPQSAKTVYQSNGSTPPSAMTERKPTSSGEIHAAKGNNGRSISPRILPSRFEEFLKNTQEILVALQKLGELTANLHKQFLDGQDRALQIFQDLLEQQQQAWKGSPVAQFQPMEVAKQALPRASEFSPTPSLDEPPVKELASTQLNGFPQPQHAAAIRPEIVSDRTKEESATVQATLLDVVSEKTGYPVEMLELGMEMDSDLGIDSIKRVEILSLLQERMPEAPVIKAEHLGTLRTLRQVMQFLIGPTPSRSEAQSQVNENKADTPPEIANLSQENVETAILQAVAEKTGYPTEMLELDMEMDADLGIDSIKRVEILSVLQERLPHAPIIKAEHLGSLRTLREVSSFLSQSSTQTTHEPHDRGKGKQDSEVTKLSAQANGKGVGTIFTCEEQPLFRYVLRTEALTQGKNRPFLNLPKGAEIGITDDGTGLTNSLIANLDRAGYRSRRIRIGDDQSSLDQLASLIVVAPPGQADVQFLESVFRLIKAANPSLIETAKQADAVLVTVSRMDGAFGVKNWQDNCNPISGGLAGLAKTFKQELPEVNTKAIDLAWDYSDLEKAAEEIVEEMFLAGPIEVGVSKDGRCTIALIEKALEPLAVSPELHQGDVIVVSGGARGVTAETAIALAKAFAPTLVLLGRSPEPTPEPEWLSPLQDEIEIKKTLASQLNGNASLRVVAERYQELTSNREILHNLDRIRQASAKVFYRQVDVADEPRVRACLADIQATIGPIRGLIHGAGVLADRLIVDKTPEQFSKVLATKVSGLHNLLNSVDNKQLKLLALFSSTTARLGRRGQVDYAVANEVLNKLAVDFAYRYPSCRTLAVNWGPWDGGMVTSSLKTVFEKEGIGLISKSAGAEHLLKEIRQPREGAIETVVLASPLPSDGPHHGEKSKKDLGTTVMDRPISVDLCPFLASHVLEGQAVLPMAMTAEWLAQAALHSHPGMVFQGFNDLRIFKGIRLLGDQLVSLSFRAGKADKKDSHLSIPMEISSKDNKGRELRHARAEIVLAREFSTAEKLETDVPNHPFWRSVEEVYAKILFHGHDFQGIRQIEGFSERGIAARVGTAQLPSKWMKNPLRNSWIMDPLALDCAFQLMVLWTHENHDADSLPCFVKGYRQYQRSFPKDEVRVVVTITSHGASKALADMAFIDSQGKPVASLTGYECVIDPSLTQAFRRNRLGQEVLPS